MPLLKGATFGHPSEMLSVLDLAAHGLPFTKSALETAAWDAWSRARGVPAARLFGDRERLSEIPTRASVGCYDVPQSVRIATEFCEAGIRTLKFKIGVPGMDDAARLRAVRERLGNDIVITVDANGAYATAGEAVRAIEALLPYDVALVEQPTPRSRFSLLAEVRRCIDVPVMADECIFTVNDLREALDQDACDIVSLYPGKNGGVSHTVEMARLVQQAGKRCAIGSNLETDLGQAAMAAVAAGLSAFPVHEIACDLPAALFYPESSVTEALKLSDGRVLVPTGNGFGVTPLVFGEDWGSS